MSGYPAQEAAARGGVAPDTLTRFAKLGLVTAELDGNFSDNAVRRAQLVASLERAGLPLEQVATMLGQGWFSLDFIDVAGATVFAPMSNDTFRAVSERTGVPLDLLLNLREIVGGGRATADARVRVDELAIVPLIELQIELGFRPQAIEQALRVYGDGLRRIAETEAEWWRNEIQNPMLARGQPEAAIADLAAEVSPRLGEASDAAILSMYHSQQMLAWTTNIVNGFAAALDRAGLHKREMRPPALCFVDVSGYTQFSVTHGDDAAASLAEALRRTSQRAAGAHGGRAVKWLGDGVMFHFPDASTSVPAALAIRDAIAEAGLPPSHLGIHAGSIIFQEGDYYGQTVNLAARIGDFARPGEVLVSEAVVEHSTEDSFKFREIGAVDLKGIGGPVWLFAAERV